MKKLLLKLFNKTKIVRRKYYATGIGTFLINLIVKKIFRLYKEDFLLHFTSRINSPQKIQIVNWDTNKTVHLCLATSSGCYYQAINGIQFGDGTIWAPNVVFISSNHDIKDLNRHVLCSPIIIGNNVWIGANTVILPMVKIGNNSIVGAGSVVTKPIPDNCIVAGNPSKVIAKRCQICLEKVIPTEQLCDKCKNT